MAHPLPASGASAGIGGAASAHQPTGALVGRLWRGHLAGQKWRTGLALLCMSVAAMATAGNAWLLQPALDELFLERDETMLVLVPLAIVGLALLKGVAGYAQEVLMAFVGQRIIADLQKAMFRHLMCADVAYFQGNTTGRLISRFTVDVHYLRGALEKALTGMAKDALTLLCLVLVMFYQDWRLALLASVVLPATVLPILHFGRKMRRVSSRTQEHMGSLTTLLDQTFQGARHVKSYGMEAHETSRANQMIDGVFRLIYKTARIRSASRPIVELLASSAVAGVIFYGGSRVLAGTTTPGAFFSFIAALLMAYQPLKALSSFNAELQNGLAAAQRIFGLLDEPPSIVDRPGARPLEIGDGTIRFERVSFAYGADGPVLRDLSFEAPGGRTVALVGPSGSGKSTILNLIPRFFDVQSGSISVDGTDIRDATIASLRAAMALVSQEVVLFDDTVRANIAYGRPGASDAEVEEAARGAAAHEFILELPDGYATRVGEHGFRLSGGQRQRIAIARAMLKNAPILLLDEATSSLDTDSERQVQAALSRLMQGRTTLVIAHRLSTVTEADLIHVVDQGRIAESGTHASLLAKRSIYARLHAMQYAPGEAGREATLAATGT